MLMATSSNPYDAVGSVSTRSPLLPSSTNAANTFASSSSSSSAATERRLRTKLKSASEHAKALTARAARLQKDVTDARGELAVAQGKLRCRASPGPGVLSASAQADRRSTNDRMRALQGKCNARVAALEAALAAADDRAAAEQGRAEAALAAAEDARGVLEAVRRDHEATAGELEAERQKRWHSESVARMSKKGARGCKREAEDQQRQHDEAIGRLAEANARVERGMVRHGELKRAVDKHKVRRGEERLRGSM